MPPLLKRITLSILTALHVLMGAYYLPTAVQTGYASFSFTENIIGADFIVYYAAAHILHTAAGELYNITTYQDVYALIRPSFILPKTHIFFPYLSPPALAFLIYPLSFLPLKAAFLTFSFINTVLLLILVMQVRTMVRDSPLETRTLFLQSLLLCVFPVFNVFLQGQISIIVCVLSMAFLLDMRAQKPQRSGLWLALAIHIKPQYFIPALFVLVGQKQWKQVIACVLYIITLAVLSTFICGIDIWQKYMQALFIAPEYVKIHLPMVNFRGILELYSGRQAFVSWITNLCYIAVCMYAALGSYPRPNNPTILLAVMGLSLFFSPYTLSHDMLLFLPVGLVVLALLYSRVSPVWLFSGYCLIVWGPYITFAKGGELVPFYLLNCFIGALLTVLALYTAYLQRSDSATTPEY